MSDLYELHIPFGLLADLPEGQAIVAHLPADTRIEAITGLDRIGENLVIYAAGGEPSPAVLDVDIWVTDGLGGRRRIA